MSEQLPSSMHAAVIDQFGGVENIHVETIPVPEIDADGVLIRVESAGVGAWDPFEREGGFVEMMKHAPTFPYVLGSEGAGTVVAVGARVTQFKHGDRVYAAPFLNPSGGLYAEYAAVNGDVVSHIPDNLTVEQAGVLSGDAITALRGLDDTLGLNRGESLLVFGASGGIGHFAVQLAKRMGVRVLAVASGNDGVELAKRLGADAVVNGRQQEIVGAAREFAPNGIDAALLTAGGDAAEQAIECIRDGGRVAYPNGVMPEPRTRPDLTITNYDGDADAEIIARLNYLIDAPGAPQFDVHVARTFTLSQAADAHGALDEHYLGKLAILP